MSVSAGGPAPAAGPPAPRPAPAPPHPRPRLTSVRRSARPGPFPGCRHRPAGRGGGKGGGGDEEAQGSGGAAAESPTSRGARGQARPPAGDEARGRGKRLTGGRRRRLPRGPAVPSRDGAGLTARRGRGGPATSAWAARGPSPGSGLPPSLRPQPGTRASRQPPRRRSPAAAHVTRRRGLREHVTPRSCGGGGAVRGGGGRVAARVTWQGGGRGAGHVLANI